MPHREAEFLIVKLYASLILLLWQVVSGVETVPHTY